MEVEQSNEMKQVLALLMSQSEEMKRLSTQMAALTTQSAGLSSVTQDLAAKTQALTEKTQSMSVQVADNANNIHEMSSRLTALEGGGSDDGSVQERPAKQAKVKGSGGVSVGASTSRSAGAAGSGLPPSLQATGVHAAPALYLSAAKQASAAGVPQGN